MLSLQENLYIYNKIVGDVDHGKRKHREASQLFWEIISQRYYTGFGTTYRLHLPLWLNS